MPQFDTLSFFSQLIGVFSGFVCLYLYFTLIGLPSIATILKVRNSKLVTTHDAVNTPITTVVSEDASRATLWPFRFLMLWPKLAINESFGKSLTEQLCKSETFLSSMTIKMIWFNSLLLFY